MHQTSGKFVIAGIFLVALAASLMAIGYRHLATRRTLAFWGTQSVELINRASQVAALHFDPPIIGQHTDQQLLIKSRSAKSRNVSSARGILNIRQALIEDKTFRWDQPAETTPSWDYGLLFLTPPNNGVVVLFASASSTIGNSSGESTVQLDPRAGEEFKAFFEEQFENRQSNQP